MAATTNDPTPHTFDEIATVRASSRTITVGIDRCGAWPPQVKIIYERRTPGGAIRSAALLVPVFLLSPFIEALKIVEKKLQAELGECSTRPRAAEPPTGDGCPRRPERTRQER